MNTQYQEKQHDVPIEVELIINKLNLHDLADGHWSKKRWSDGFDDDQCPDEPGLAFVSPGDVVNVFKDGYDPLDLRSRDEYQTASVSPHIPTVPCGATTCYHILTDDAGHYIKVRPVEILLDAFDLDGIEDPTLYGNGNYDTWPILLSVPDSVWNMSVAPHKGP